MVIFHAVPNIPIKKYTNANRHSMDFWCIVWDIIPANGHMDSVWSYIAPMLKIIQI